MFSDDRGRVLAIHQPLRPCPFCGHDVQEIWETGRAFPCDGDARPLIVAVLMVCRCGASLQSRVQIGDGASEHEQIIRHISDRWCERADD